MQSLHNDFDAIVAVSSQIVLLSGDFTAVCAVSDELLEVFVGYLDPLLEFASKFRVLAHELCLRRASFIVIAIPDFHTCFSVVVFTSIAVFVFFSSILFFSFSGG